MADEDRSRLIFSPIVWAMVASVWVHILAFAIWQYADPLPTPPTSPPLTLEIELPVLPDPEAMKLAEAGTPQPDTPGETMSTESIDSKTAEPKPEPAEETKTAQAPEPAATESPAPPADEETISLESRAPQYVSYLGQIKAAVKRHWIWPPQAREKRQSGQLSAIFTVDSDGQLVSIRVEQSSGLPILDHAAMEAVRGAAPFPPFPEHISLKRLSIVANFDYRIRYIKVGEK